MLVSPIFALTFVSFYYRQPTEQSAMMQKNWWKVYSFLDVDLSSTTSNIDIYGSNTNIYVLDSGIDLTHSEFTGKDISLVYSLTGDFNDTNGHGTGLASLMVGNTCGVTSTSIKVVKIFDDAQPTKQSDFLHALDAILTDMNSNINKFIGIFNKSIHTAYVFSIKFFCCFL